jgi:LCP family protein required for cell wall assembly
MAKQNEPPRRLSAAARRRRRKKKQRRLYFLICIFAILLISGTWAMSKLSGGIEIEEPGLETGNETGQTELSIAETSGRKKGFYTFLLVGMDKGSSNTDTIVIGAFDTKSKNVSMLQIPRDTILNVSRKHKRINASYAINGIDGFKEELTDFLGIPIDRYAIINLSGFRDVVDALGGVEVTVPPGMEYYDPYQDLVINVPPGTRTLMGADAEGFVRFRSGYADADLGRLKAQKAFISSFIKKALGRGILKMPKVLKTGFNSIKETDLNFDDYLYLGGQAASLGSEDMKFYTLPGEPMKNKGVSYYGAYDDSLLSIINESFNPYNELLTLDDLNVKSFTRKNNSQFNTDASNLDEAAETDLSKIIYDQNGRRIKK